MCIRDSYSPLWLLSNVLKPLFAGIHLVHFFLPRTKLLKISWENDLFLCFVQTLSAIIDSCQRFPNKLWVTNSSGNRQEETEMRITKIVRFSVCPCRLFIYLSFLHHIDWSFVQSKHRKFSFARDLWSHLRFNNFLFLSKTLVLKIYSLCFEEI